MITATIRTENSWSQLGFEDTKETLRFASDEVTREAASQISLSCYTYCIRTLPQRKAKVLTEAREQFFLASHIGR